MTNRHTIPLHGDYLDGDLSPERKQEIGTHLDGCADCRRDFDALRGLKTTLASFDAPDPGKDYFDSLTASIMAKTQIEPDTAVETPEFAGTSVGRMLKMMIRLAAAITLLFTAFYTSDLRQEKILAQTQARAVSGNYFRYGGASLPDEEMLPGPGINMIGAPAPESAGQTVPDSNEGR